jgi:hypothetical protein
LSATPIFGAAARLCAESIRVREGRFINYLGANRNSLLRIKMLNVSLAKPPTQLFRKFRASS